MNAIARNATSFDATVPDKHTARPTSARRSAKRTIVTLSLAGTLALGAIIFPAPAFPSQINKPSVCTLACNPIMRTCSRYPSNQVPLLTTRPRSIPDLYRVVPSGTRCDSLVCVQDPYMCVIGNI